MLEKAKVIFEKNKDIKYGWKSRKDSKYYFHITEGLAKNFCFQTCEEIEKSRIGICWETVELNREYLEKNNISCKAYFFVIPFNNFYCHSVLVFNDKNKYYWFENSFKDLIGIHEYDSLQELFKFSKFICNRIINLAFKKCWQFCHSFFSIFNIFRNIFIICLKIRN